MSDIHGGQKPSQHRPFRTSVRLQVEAVPSAERLADLSDSDPGYVVIPRRRFDLARWLHEAALRLEELQVAGTGRDGRLRSRASSRRVGVGERELD